jgi:hypothetical protein
MLATTPLKIGPTGVTLWFICLLTALSCWSGLVAFLIERRLQPSLSSPRRIANAWRRGLFIGGYLTALIALSSLQQLNARDAILFAILLLLIEFYMVMRG